MTMSPSAEAALAALRALNWTVQLAAERVPLPAAIDARYGAIPQAVRAFLEQLEVCTGGDERAWFLGSADYAGQGDSAFAWDEWERISADEADAMSAAQSRAFWDAHLPILQSVDGDYAYLAVCVDSASADYGHVVRGDGPAFEDASVVCRSFDELLSLIAAANAGPVESDLIDLILDPHDARRLQSSDDAGARGGLIERALGRLRRLPLFESYRVCVVLQSGPRPPLWAWDNWSTILPPLNAVVAGLDDEAVIRPRQAGDHDNWLRFGRLPWSEASNRTWTTKYLDDPAMAGKVQFVATEIWAPSRAISFDARRGPQLFCLLDRNMIDGEQGFVLAVRKDVLWRVDVAADAVIFAAREFLGTAKHATFDRSWGESGRFGSIIVTNGLDYTNSGAVLNWAKSHLRRSVPSFRWRRRG
jgi:hypothetical protein